MSVPVHIYGITASGAVEAVELEGLRGEPVRPVQSEGLTALVSTTPEDLHAGRKDLLAHAGVLEQLAERVTVLPMQFGMAMSSDEDVRQQVIAADRDRLAGLLERLDGTVQLTVKAYHEEEPALREVLRRSPQAQAEKRRLAALPKDASYYRQIQMGERIYGLIDQLRGEDAAHILERLSPLALDVVQEEVSGMNQVVNAAFLVRRNARDRFSDAVSSLAEEMSARLRLRYLGPQPPYSFVDRASSEPAWA